MRLSLLCFWVLATCWACSQTNNNDRRSITAVDNDEILVVYLSRTNNTKAIAEIIQRNVGGDLVAVELETPYPDNYKATVEKVAKENETGYLPPLKTKIKNLEQYKIVFIGFPTWGMQLPPPIKSFLSTHDLSGKIVAPFNTNGGYGIGSTFETLKKLCLNCQVIDGFSIKGGVERDGQYLAIKGERGKTAEVEVKKWLETVDKLAHVEK